MDHHLYLNKTDEELLEQYRAGETDVMDYLLEKYKNLVRMKANTMFLLGGDTDDLIQEGMIGLFKAIQDYRPDRESSFFTFAGICITRQIYKAVEAAARKKHGPLNSYVSLSASDDSEMEQVHHPLNDNPEMLLIGQEEVEDFLVTLEQSLSPLERQVLHLHMSGNNYHEIAEILDKPEKSIDNALQRMKQKIYRLRDNGL